MMLDGASGVPGSGRNEFEAGLRRMTPDACLIDLGLPDRDGLALVHRLATESGAAIIIISGRAQVQDRVTGLELGADDYVTKPFAMDEFLARVRAQVRRTGLVDAPAPAKTEAFEVNFEARTVTRDGTTVRLTPTEWKIVDVLVRNADRLVSQQTLLHEVWGPSYSRETNYLRVYMGQLRRKLEREPAAPRWLITTPGIGYQLRAH